MPSIGTTTITIQLLCFAQVKDLLGESELTLTLPAGATGTTVWTHLCARAHQLAPLLEVSRLAVNGEDVPWEATVQGRD